MSEQSSSSLNAGPAEREAERLVTALEASGMMSPARKQRAARYGERLRFALARIGELRASAVAFGGVFEPARLEVAVSILDSQIEQARAFVEGVPARPGRRMRAVVAVAETDIEAADVARRAA